MFLIAAVLFLIPLILLASLAFIRRFPSRWQWLSTTMAIIATLGFLWITARWDILSMYYRMLLPVLILATIYMAYRRIRKPEKPWSMAANIITHVINFALIVFMSGASWKALEGYPEPANAIQLTAPVRDANFVVLHGGASPLINGHFWVKSQKYALDILGQDKLGRSATAFADRKDLHSYPIYGAPVYSPCDGSVAITVDEFEDQAPPRTDRDNLAGNHVLINCLGVEVLLAHLKMNSIQVNPGDAVNTETILGAVGNTGNTSEPHLHIHAETATEPSLILDGKSVPFTIEGRWLVRGNRF